MKVTLLSLLLKFLIVEMAHDMDPKKIVAVKTDIREVAGKVA